jgi:hypothetical protein
MDKLLKVLVALLLVLAVIGLILGSTLYGKRELLKARTQKLENALVALGASLEAKQPDAPRRVDYPERDLSPCSDEMMPNPELSAFWQDYNPALEQQENPMLDLNPYRAQLMAYFKVDPVTGKPIRDAMGRPLTTGEGTMQAVLDDILAKASAQYARLTETRQQLTNVRAELVDAIQDINSRKRELRVALKDITDLKATIAPLKAEIATLNDRIEILNEEKDVLQADILDLKAEVAALQEQNSDTEQQLARLKEENDSLRKIGGSGDVQPAVASQDGSMEDFIMPALPTGAKGRVIAVREDWKFVVVELRDAFVAELSELNIEGRVPGLTLMVTRPGAERDRFITKVKLVHLKTDQKMAVADIMTDWQQDTVREGDILSY